MTGMVPFFHDELFSKLLLGTVKSPGKVVLSGHERNPKWDVQAAKGSTGASTTLNDPNPVGSFTATFYLSAENEDGGNDFELWDEFQKLIESTTQGTKPFALPIYHPDLARNRYTNVTNAGVGGMLHDGQGGASVAVKFQEYRPAKPKPAAKPTAKGASSTPGKGANSAKPDPNAKAKAELAALLAEAKAA